MLAMHYRIPLIGPDAADKIRLRAVQRGPLFDGMPGLAHKFFLLDPANPTYATFYLWHDAESAHAFLDGPFFAALSETFGRPEVRLLFTTGIHLPRVMPPAVTLVKGIEVQHFGARIDAFDPRNGVPVSLRFDDAVRGQRFEMLYHARGDVAALPEFEPASA